MTDLDLLTQKYTDEAAKRFRSDGSKQFVELDAKKLAADPWVDHAVLNALPSELHDGDEVQFLVVGAGFSALQYAVRLLQAKFCTATDICLVDVAGGVGGTWYWNRYPGIMCDVDSSVYMPLLEETGRMPKHLYSYGPELREHAEAIAKQFELRAMLRTKCSSCHWDDDTARWTVTMHQDRGPEGGVELSVSAQFLVVTGGVLNHPKIPDVPGVHQFTGAMMHTSRWDYSVTGGSPEDWALQKLAGKRVGIVGTGATAIQCIPELARHAKELYVFQRTASVVDVRGQKERNAKDWGTITAKASWWRERNANNSLKISGYPVSGENTVLDGWATKGFKYRVGGRHEDPITDMQSHIQEALAGDAEDMDRVRRRIDSEVTDDAVAARLKPWYPSWCKRPCFHDEYLATFNHPHVHLVDTDGKGIQRLTPDAIIANDTSYPLDVLIWSTGFRSAAGTLVDPAVLCNTSITSSTADLSHLWRTRGPSAFHGVLTPWIPNLLLLTPVGAGTAVNYVYTTDTLARHSIYIVSEALKRCKNPDRVTIRADAEATEKWGAKIAKSAGYFSPASVCGPSYFDDEGGLKNMSEEQMRTRAKAAVHSRGIGAFIREIEEWEAKCDLDGVVVEEMCRYPIERRQEGC